MSSNTHDLVVIGAGPAGMSAAVTAASNGMKTMLLDEQPRPGGKSTSAHHLSRKLNALGTTRGSSFSEPSFPLVKAHRDRRSLCPLQEWGSVS